MTNLTGNALRFEAENGDGVLEVIREVDLNRNFWANGLAA